MIKYENSCYLSVGEVFDALPTEDFLITNPIPDENIQQGGTFCVTQLENWLEDYGVDFMASWPSIVYYVGTTLTWSKYVKELLTHAFNKYFDEIAVVARVWGFPWDNLDAEMNSMLKVSAYSFLRNLFVLIQAHYDRYATLLDGYAAEKTHLLEKVRLEGAALNRYNDAPQNSGDYSGDAYASNYTVTETGQEVDHGTPMQRIDEIDRAYRNLLNEWASTFKPLFILKENLR